MNSDATNVPPEREIRRDTQAPTHAGDAMGTLDYMCARSRRRPADICADIYSLGCTLYALLTGHAVRQASGPRQDPRTPNRGTAADQRVVDGL